MINAAQALQRSLKRVPDVDQMVAKFLTRDGVLASVQFGEGAPVSIPAVGQYPPWPGDSVQVERRNGRLVMTGPTVAKSGMGTITATGTPKATVVCDGVEYLLPYRDGYTPVVSDDVEINWVTQVIQGKVTTLVPPPVVDPGTGGGTAGPFDFTFPAQQSGTWNGTRWQSNDVQASDHNMGAWFYGATLADTLRDDWTVTGTFIYLPLVQELNVCNIGLHGATEMDPGSWPGSTADIPLDPRSGWVQLPNEFGAGLNVFGGGITVTSGNGLNVWLGTQSDGASGSLHITGTKP
jgi:hypothetical protein